MKFRSANRLSPDAIGRRVTIRRRLPEGGSSDTVGVLLAIDDQLAVVWNKQGEEVTIAITEVVASRIIEG